MTSVAVVGTGAVGSMALWRLAARGIPATGFDTYAPGHDRGASGGETRIFRTAYKEGPQYVPLLHEARALWTELEQAAGTRLLTPVGGVTVGPRDHPAVDAVLAAARAHDLPVEVLTGKDAAERVPEHPLRDGEVMVADRDAGYLRPEPAVVAAAATAERAGATIRRYTPRRAGTGGRHRRHRRHRRRRAALHPRRHRTGPLGRAPAARPAHHRQGDHLDLVPAPRRDPVRARPMPDRHPRRRTRLLLLPLRGRRRRQGQPARAVAGDRLARRPGPQRPRRVRQAGRGSRHRHLAGTAPRPRTRRHLRRRVHPPTATGSSADRAASWSPPPSAGTDSSSPPSSATSSPTWSKPARPAAPSPI
ncbi:FAD-dependent oxidoreductase [Nonomuraea salmonea]|uniref:FAD-dependent oxidoreductase n=1 Tax=Nonomuraea salmonea TaxID=46181 RepID=UPI0031E795A2